MLKIGNIELPEFPLLLAPMEDVSDPPFRALCKEQGADVVYTEFISSEGLIRNAAKSTKKLDIYSKKDKLLVNELIIMIEFKRSKKNRSKNALFNPYKNGISSYDMAYLSSKRNFKNKTVYLENDSKKDYVAA